MIKPCHNDCIEMAFPQCVTRHVLLEYYSMIKTYLNGCIEMVSPPFASLNYVLDYYSITALKCLLQVGVPQKPGYPKNNMVILETIH